MKICPKCNTQYEYEMSFCLQDGTPLVIEGASSEPTQIMQNNELSEKTLTLPSQIETAEMLNTEETKAATKNIISIPPTVEPKFDAFETPQHSRSGLIFGSIFGVLALLATAIGSVFLFNPFGQNNQVALANTNTSSSNQTVNSSNNSNVSVIGGSNSNLPTNVNSKTTPTASPTLSNVNKTTAKPTESPAETATPKPTVTPTPATPTPTPIPTPTPQIKIPPKVVNGGVLNGKAISLVRPAFPPAAKAVGAGGAVNVRITLDETGNVISANAVSGHPLLRSSAESAARSSRFSPTLVNGQPVKVTGVIIYNFSPQ